MILLDTSVLVAMINPNDELRARVGNDHRHFAKEMLLVSPAVLMEAVHLLPSPILREKLHELIRNEVVQLFCFLETEDRFTDVFDWLTRYAEHVPDWADGCLAVLSGIHKRLRVWTYDNEFKAIWRRPDGSRIPLAVS
jgi:predicted nucleic acid-binding protein